MDVAWQRQVLENEGLGDWTIKIAADAYCWSGERLIQLPDDADPALFLHEVAHALHPEKEGPLKNHYHGGGWASVFGILISKYMTVKPIGS